MDLVIPDLTRKTGDGNSQKVERNMLVLGRNNDKISSQDFSI